MADVQFSEETALAPRPVSTPRSSMAAWLVRAGWAKNEKQAEYFLIGIAVTAFVTMLLILSFSTLRPKTVPLNPLEQRAPGSTPGNPR